jgi:hypothetical protein
MREQSSAAAIAARSAGIDVNDARGPDWLQRQREREARRAGLESTAAGVELPSGPPEAFLTAKQLARRWHESQRNAVRFRCCLPESFADEWYRARPVCLGSFRDPVRLTCQ